MFKKFKFMNWYLLCLGVASVAMIACWGNFENSWNGIL